VSQTERHLLIILHLKKTSIFVLFLVSTLAAIAAGPTNAILFVTQVPIPADFTTIASTFGNQQATPDSCGRGGDLYVRYPDGTLKNLTRAAGYGLWGSQNTNGIAVRQPCVYWDGKKAVFSMVVGAPKHQFDYTTVSYWQLYEITNFSSPTSVPVITKIPNQPTNYNNIAPIYGTDGRIIFTSDRPRNGQANLYPQLDEYEEAPTVTGLWSLLPSNGNLFNINHTPSGAFSPLIDSAGRVIFVRWDHLQRDQQADTDWEEGYITYGAFNWSDESLTSVPTTNLTELFPEPRSPRTDLLAGTGLQGCEFNQFFPWAIDQDGTDEETVNHIGRHEIGGSYASASFTNDPNIVDMYDYETNYNTNTIVNFLQVREDLRTPGLFYGIDAPEFGSHSGGQIVSITGATNLNAFYMKVNYLTPVSTRSPADSPTTVPADFTGLYRNPLMTSDGFMIAAHTTNSQDETEDSDPNFPSTAYDFRLKFLQLSNGYYVPSATLTSGLTNQASYWDPDILITQTNNLWEFDPVEVIARTVPTPYEVPLPAQEQAAFTEAGVNVTNFQNYLQTHDLALIVSRDVTTRDHADRQQPYNLRVDQTNQFGTNHSTIGAKGKVYDVDYLQFFQADQLRSLNYGNTNNTGNGRRVIAQYLHDPAVDNPTPVAGPTASVQIASDGSQATIVPAGRAMTWQLTDSNGVGVVRERYWLTFAAGEIRSCTSCHGINEETQANGPVPTNTPLALVQLLGYWKTNSILQTSVVTNQGLSYFQISFVRRPAETGVTYHVQNSSDLVNWTDIATYAATNIVLTSKAVEVSRIGSPDESVTVRETSTVPGNLSHFLRVHVTRP
jgi:Hydrazine synthase alpha subunit middle domain